MCTPSFTAVWITEWQVLLPSPTNVNVRPCSDGHFSVRVKKSDSAWHGCTLSDNPLMTGMSAAAARSSSTLCLNVRATMQCVQRSRFFAMSLTDSREPMRASRWSMNDTVPPRSFMPMSNVKRVRSESFSKIIARRLLRSTDVCTSRPRFSSRATA